MESQVEIVGREAELAVVHAFLGQAPAGTIAVRLAGEAGTGKTTLWRAAVEAAAARSYAVLTCRPAEAEAKLSYAPLADLLDPVLDDVLPELPLPQRRGLEVALLRAGHAEPADERAVAFGFLATVKSVATSSPVLLAIDDAQWLDGPSSRVLRFALRRLGDYPVRVLYSVRTESGGRAVADLDTAFDATTAAERLRRVDLDPLSLASLHQVLLARTGVAVPRRTLLRIQQAAAGNVFYALEMAREVAARTEPLAPGDALPIPLAVNELVARRVADLPAATQEALLAAAALAHPTAGLVTAVERQWHAGDVLRPAEQAALIVVDRDRLRFSHPLVAAAVYEAATPASRRDIHRRLAEAVTNPEERARHLALAAAGPDAAVAAVLDTAAAHARARGAPDAAAELGELAADATPAHAAAEASHRRVDAAENHLLAGDRQRARFILEERLPGFADHAERARVLHLLGQIRYHDDSFPAAADLLRRARAEAAEIPSALAAIECDLTYVRHTHEAVSVAAEHAHAALRAAEQHGEPGLLAEALAVVTVVDFLCGHGVDEARIARALELEDVTRRTPAPIRPSVIHGMLMSWLGRSEAARASLEGLRARLVGLGDEASLPFVAFALAFDACWRGDLEAAERHGQEGFEISQRSGSEVIRAHGLTARAVADAYLGRLDAARSQAEEAIALFDAAGCPRWASAPRAVLGFLYLSVDDVAAAAHELRPLVAFFADIGIDEPAAVPFLLDAIEALIALGERDLAEPLLAWLTERGTGPDRPWARASALRGRGLLLAADGDLDGALEAFELAIQAHEQLSNPVERARTLLLLGQCERRANRRRQARATLEHALAIFDEVGAELWSRRTKAELSRLGLRRQAGAELTPRERQIAERVAKGATNNEVAAALFVSPKTVEANLARVYRKLGIHSRAELGALMAEPRATKSP